MTVEPEHRVLLRAEIAHRNHEFVGTTTWMSRTHIFVCTTEDGLVGEKADLRLSFPGLMKATDFQTRIAATHLPEGPGEPGGWTLSFDTSSPATTTNLRVLNQRLAEGPASAVPQHILVVEDSSLLRDVFCHYFEGRESCLRLHFAQNTQEAVVRLAAQTFDVLLIDYLLPDQPGDQLVCKLRQGLARACPALIGMSSDGDRARQAMLDAGADLFLEKPIVMSDLFGTLEMLMQESS